MKRYGHEDCIDCLNWHKGLDSQGSISEWTWGCAQICLHLDNSWLYQIVSEIKHDLVYKIKNDFTMKFDICLQLWTIRETFAFSACLVLKKDIATGISLALTMW